MSQDSFISRPGNQSGPSPTSASGRFDLLMSRSYSHLDYFTQHIEVAAQGGGTVGHHTVARDALETVVGPFAALLLLSWIEYSDCSTESIGRSDTTTHQPLLTPDQHWSAWRHLPGKELPVFFDRQLVPALKGAPNIACGSMLQSIADALMANNALPGDIWDRLISWVGCFDMSSATARRAAQETITEVAHMTTPPDALTTSALAALMVEVLDPGPGGTIYDPCFGTGTLLALAVRWSHSGRESLTGGRGAPAPPDKVWGVEINPHAYLVGAVQTALAGASPPRLELRDALEGPRPPARKETRLGADYIIAHPPWGRAKRDTHNPFPVATNDIAMRFLQHVMTSLNPGGRAVVALPEHVLHQRGAAREVRRQLLSEYSIEGVIAVPSRTSLPVVVQYANASVNLVVFRRATPKATARFLSVPKDLGHLSQSKIAVKFRDGQPDSHMWDTPLDALKKREWELSAKRTGQRALARKLTWLCEANSNVATLPLRKVAEVRAGKAYRNAITLPDADGASEVRLVEAGAKGQVLLLVRVADVRDSGVRMPAMYGSLQWEPREAAQESAHADSERLRSGDILLTTSGTIGRIAVLDALTLGAVAAAGIAVIRPSDAIRASFLKCVLASDAYQSWLTGHARGSVIQHLSIARLRELAIPVPSIALQERVVRLVSGERGEPFAAIVRIIANTHDAVVEWIEESVEVRELHNLGNTKDGPALLERIADSLRKLSDKASGSRTRTVPELARWLEEVAEPVAALEGLTDIPPGPERLAVLDGLSFQLERIAAPRDPSSPATALAHDVTRRISSLASLERERILAKVAVEADIEPNWEAEGAETEMQLRLTNRSLLPFRRFEAFTLPKIGEARTAYLPVGATLNVPLRIPSDVRIGSYSFKVHWRAALLNGSQAKGRIPMTVDVRASRSGDRVREIGTSPYIVGSPIDRKEMLFGREGAIEEIRRQLRVDSRANVVLLEGNRRTGKTSILKRLQDPEVLPDWITVNCSLQGGEGHASKTGLPTREVFRLMARDLGWAAHAAGIRVWLPDSDAPDPDKPFKVALVGALHRAFAGDRPFETFELFLQTVIEAARPRRILLMLDEFDKLQEGIDSEVTSPQVPENIRYLLHSYPELSAILAGSRRIKRIREEYWSALFGFGHRVPVSGLQLEDARLLVTRPVDGRLVYVPEARDLVVQLCARQPFLIQSLCNRIFESAARSTRRTVTVDDVNTAAEAMTDDNEHFRTLWGYAGTERRRFLLALCRNLRDGPPITLDLLEQSLRRHGVHLHRGERFGDDLEFLRELELLELRGTRGESAYQLAIPLMGAWIERNVDFEHQRRRAVEEFEEADQGEGYGISGEDENANE